MKIYRLSALLFSFLSSAAFADTYSVTFGWTDPTTYLPGETAIYSAKYRIAGGAETVIPNLTVSGGTVSVTATPGQTIEISGRECNSSSPTLCSAWMAWTAATAQHPATQPATGTNMTITVVRTGP